MTTVALVVSAILILLNGLLRAAGASLVRTPRADALHDARGGDQRAERIASILADRPKIQPALGMVGAECRPGVRAAGVPLCGGAFAAWR